MESMRGRGGTPEGGAHDSTGKSVPLAFLVRLAAAIRPSGLEDLLLLLLSSRLGLSGPIITHNRGDT